MTMSSEFELNDPPTDGITSLQFSPTDPHLLVASSWDKSVRLYDTNLNHQVKPKFMHDAPVLDCCFDHGSDMATFSAGLDCRVVRYDWNKSTEETIGTHSQPVKSLYASADHRLLVSGGWDAALKLWDTRTPEAVATHALPGKVYSMHGQGDYVVAALEARGVWVFDLRKGGEVVQKRESSLKYQTRCVRVFPDGRGFVLSSIEGRVAVEYIDSDPATQSKKYAFKCHRQLENNTDTVYPVHAIAFHPSYHTFATGGGDGGVNVWDAQAKKRIRAFAKYPTSVSALCFNCTGDALAIASSYAYEQGEKDHPPDSIYIKPISEHEVMPKSKQSS